LAARVLAAVTEPKTIYCVGQRTYAQRAIIKFAKSIGATAAPGRFTPGQFTNYRTKKKFVEPRILLVAGPRTDSQAVKEASYVNIPTIAFCGADSKLDYIDIAIPGNNRGKDSLGLLYWMLAREVKRLKGEIPREDFKNDDWARKCPVDLFFHKDIEEIEKQQEEEQQQNAFEEEYIDQDNFQPDFQQNNAFQPEEWDQGGFTDGAQAGPGGFDPNRDWADQGQGTTEFGAAQPQQPQQQPIEQQQQQQYQGNQWSQQPQMNQQQNYQQFNQEQNELDDWDN